MNEKKNIMHEMIDHMNEHLVQFTEKDGVVGVTLNGGLSRNYGDVLSEVDLTIYLSDEGVKDYESLSLRIPTGIVVIDNQLYDIKVVALASAISHNYKPDVELWDLQHAQILYDPSGEIEKILQANTNVASLPQLGGVMFDAWWHIKLAGDIWVYRENPAQGHLMLNDGAKSLMRAIYVVNDKYIPHEKWVYNDLETLTWLPKPVEQLMQDALYVTDFTLEGLVSRQKRLLSLYKKIDHHARNFTTGYRHVDVTMENYYRKLKQFLQYDEMSIDDALNRFGFQTLQADPFCKLFSLKGDKIFIDHERVQTLSVDDMYEWHFQVLDACKR